MYDKNNDVDRIFKEDSRDKKRTAIGVHKRASRRGYIRGGIKTQSDFLTAKQKKQLSGEVRVYNMYDKYKELSNCKLDEILAKDPKEIKNILATIKASNTSRAIFTAFGMSNGKLYDLYKQYGVPIEKRAPQPKPKTDLSKILITKERFNLMDSIGRGEYLSNIASTYSVSVGAISKHWGLNKNNLAYYVSMYKKRLGPQEPEAPDTVQPAVEQLEIPTEPIVDTTKADQLQQRLDEVEAENKKLTERLIEMTMNATPSTSKFRVEINGAYSKEDLGNRLLSLDNLTIEGTTYNIRLILEEV